MANQGQPHTPPALCNTLYYCTPGCVVQYSTPVVQQYRCRDRCVVQQIVLPTYCVQCSSMVQYSTQYVCVYYQYSVQYVCMYHCVCCCYCVSVVVCASVSPWLGSSLPAQCPCPAYLLTVCVTLPTQYINLLVMVCVQYSVCVLMQIDRCVSQYIVQQVCCVVHSFCTRVDRQYSSSVCSVYIDSIVTHTRQDRYSVVHSVVCVQ